MNNLWVLKVDLIGTGLYSLITRFDLRRYKVTIKSFHSKNITITFKQMWNQEAETKTPQVFVIKASYWCVLVSEVVMN